MGNVVEVTIAHRNGSYEGMPAERAYQVVILGAEKNGVVKVSGGSLEDYAYDKTAHQLVINVGKTACSQRVVVSVDFAATDAIDAVQSTVSADRSAVYDLQGRRIDCPPSSFLLPLSSFHFPLSKFVIRNNQIQKPKP